MTRLHSIPLNDAELDSLINQTKVALGKYFNISPSMRRSEKLRDFVCESLGFTNGGYQQLQAFWLSNTAEFIDSKFHVHLSLHGNNILFDGLFKESILSELRVLSLVVSYFGSKKQSGVNGRELSIDVKTEQFCVMQKKWHIKLGGEVLGYTDTAEKAIVLQGLLLAARDTYSADFKVAPHEDVTKNFLVLSKLKPKSDAHIPVEDRWRVLESGLHIHYKKMIISSKFDPQGELTSQMIILHTFDYGILIIPFNMSTRCYTLCGIEFDSVQACSSAVISKAFDSVHNRYNALRASSDKGMLFSWPGEAPKLCHSFGINGDLASTSRLEEKDWISDFVILRPTHSELLLQQSQ